MTMTSLEAIYFIANTPGIPPAARMAAAWDLYHMNMTPDEVVEEVKRLIIPVDAAVVRRFRQEWLAMAKVA